MMEIQAAVLREIGGPFLIETVALEPPRRHEVLVRLAGTGICHTDLKMATGYRPLPLPVVLGHEGAGVVAAVGAAVTRVRPGDPVVLSFNSCGHCDNCQEGHPAYCDEGDFLSFGCARPEDHSSPLSQAGAPIRGYFFGQSSFGTMAITTERNVVRVPVDLPLALLGPLGCGFQTGAGAIFNSLQVRAGTSLAIFGAGSVGLSALLAARAAGATTLIAVDRNEARLALARELGATHSLSPAMTPALAAAIRGICQGQGAHYALDTTNAPAIVQQAIACLRQRGVYGHVGGGGAEISVPTSHLLFGRTLTGIVQGDSVPQSFIPHLLDLYSQGLFPFDRLITFYDFADINQAVADMKTGRVVKPVLRLPDPW